MDYICSNPSSSTLHVFDLNLPPATAHDFNLNEDPTPASRGDDSSFDDDPSFDDTVPSLSIRATASFSETGRLAVGVSPPTPMTNTSTSRGVHTGQLDEPVHENEEEQQENNTRQRLSATEKKRLDAMLMGKAKEDCKLQRGVIKEVAAKFNTNRWAVHILWTKAKQQFNASLPINVEQEMRARVGRKRVTCDLGKQEGAKRSSKNRPAGTLVTKPIPFVTRDVMKRMMLNEVIPAVKAKWPDARAKRVIIQQDNAKPHVTLMIQT
ncbi:unnamed protein product [Cuscuta campestris]|uniref:Transposase Tc1-like domain-containing protein n=1 Tax=Cuscuta campestris TaxID=132261 RepID=A0A484KQ08_9ASTE|nr:unnamed protein product [Cuscuta campestris]